MLLICVAVSYNFPLSIINAHLFGVSRGALIGVEALLMGSGLLIVLSNWRADMTRWLLMIGCFFGLSLVLSLLRQTFDPKSFRDTLQFAVFIMLGMLMPYAQTRRLFVGIHIAILAVMLVEVTFPDQYGALLDPRSYFINSRGFTAEQLIGDSDLFGAVHGEDRYIFPFLGWNRASSFFLEPLSLGNYASFSMIMMVLFWRDWSWSMRLFMAVGSFVIFVGSDGRFGGTSAAILLLLAPLLMRLPAVFAVAYLPVGIVVARVASLAFGWLPVNDNFGGRMARGMKGLFRLTWEDVAGFGIPNPSLADSGIAYLVIGQSVIGVVMLQLFLYLQPRLLRSDQLFVLHATALTFALSILVSISMLSIKTAAFYWFLLGTMIALPQQQNARQPLGPTGVVRRLNRPQPI